MRLSLQQQSRVLRAFRAALIILWALTFVAIHSLTYFIYFIPLLALVTFFLMPVFPVVVGAIFLSAYLDRSNIVQISEGIKLLLVGAVGLAALIALTAKVVAGRSRVTASQSEQANPVPDQPVRSTSEPISSMSSDATLSTNFRHDVRAPLNLILGFCESLLNPTPTGRLPLPAPFRDDVDAIYRNGQHLKPLIEKLLELTTLPQKDKNVTDVVAESRQTVILLDESGAAFELFSQCLGQYQVIRVSSLEAIGQLHLDSDLLAVAINSGDSTLIPVVAQLLGKTVPILTFNLNDTQPQMRFQGANDYLAKPVEFAALLAALERIGTLPRTVLIVDDNRDNVQLLSRMLNSMTEPPQLLKAYSGREALALLHEDLPDVILLDFVLPDMEGLALLNYLRTDDRLVRIPVIIVSAHRLPDIMPAAITTKLTLFRFASFSPPQLARHIEALLNTFGSQS